ncbi:hypothetical protein ScPMuIL_012573 [Solemya velum]
MRQILLLCVAFLQTGVIIGTADNEHPHGVDPFESILEHFNITGNQLSPAELEKIVEEFSEKFHCENVVSADCGRSLCMTADDIYGSLGYNTNTDTIDEDEFEAVSNLLVFGASQLSTKCNKTIQLPQSPTGHQSQLLQNLTGSDSSTEITVSQFDVFLELIKTTYGGSHHEHDHDGEEHNHEEEGDHAHEEGEVQLSMEKCLSAGLLFDQVDKDTNEAYLSSSLGKASAFVVYHILEGSHIKENCRLFPRPSFFSEGLFSKFAENGVVDEHGFEELMKKLGLVKNDGAGEDPHAGHDHARRKRSAGEGSHDSRDHARRKRAADPSSIEPSVCYTAQQLLAIYDFNGLTKQDLGNICPALVYQQLYASCQATTAATSVVGDYSTAERYGYATLANLIICMCALTGLMLKSCMGRPAYKIVMAIFLGLASGTLISDAFIHLIPMAFGVHGHEEGHDHDHASGAIVMEPYVQYALIAVAGIYAFYLLELIMELYGRDDMKHSHGPDVNFDVTIKPSGDMIKNKVHAADDFNSASNLNMHEEMPGKSELQPREKNTLKPVAIMIILGDAIHNFADGLAMGASFAHSLPAGLATSITVFCHELPHELGDFAILLSSGLSVWRAALFNGMSSMTSFIGLYVGLAMGENDTVRMWIFGAAAGMFLYIALVDMLPTLIHNNDPDRRQQAVTVRGAHQTLREGSCRNNCHAG